MRIPPFTDARRRGIIRVMFRHAAAAALLLLTTSAAAGDWTLLSDKDGVSTFSQEIPGTRLLGFRGESELPLHQSALVDTMLDANKARDWVDLLAESRVLENGADTQVLYQRYDMAWPVADRDMVIRRTVQRDPEHGRVSVVIESVEHRLAPEVPGVVRADVQRTFFAFTALSPGRTRVEVEAFTDPRGIVPQWLVNLVQKTWARNSINALARLASGDRSE